MRCLIKLENNVILVTGSGSGIGRGLAEDFYTLGNQVIISGRRKQARSAVMNVSSGLAFVPMALTPTYCATSMPTP